MSDKGGFIYMMTNKPNGVLYIGVTSNLSKRVWEHKKKIIKGFTSRYNLDQLFWYENHDDISNATYREKRLKKYTRDAKIKLIQNLNQNWNDLYNVVCN